MKANFVWMFIALVVVCVGTYFFKTLPWNDHALPWKDHAPLEMSTQQQTTETDAQSVVEPDVSARQAAEDTQPSVEKVLALRLLCWVLTGTKTSRVYGAAIMATWGPRCDKLLFMSSEKDEADLPGRVSLRGVYEGRPQLVAKSRAAWTHVWERYSKDYDWFLKCDDDAYIIVENLKLMLYPHPQTKPIIMGRKLRDGYIRYMSGGPGYVMNRPALELLGNAIKTGCMHSDNVHEDQLVSICLRMMGAELREGHDARGVHRVMLLTPELHLNRGMIVRTDYFWTLKRVIGTEHGHLETLEGPSCCSDLAVAFHYVKPPMQRVLEFLIYRLQRFGERQRTVVMKNTTSELLEN
ncbi:glycoprotein-N-acetylgalactosamine 3-beta-galactosyltransferase 1-like [Sycon ciliatum]|uniref:glycoprotein-N-acetylgalactosamine 3-beta-galactosyltransferase 1-like n=1 Tax=Sycon ciliatum TaxID=27933 RepID=UPI0020A999D1|eukprot:scpid82547/ scgid24218/ Glycoprotein-N-acetylgalactosamine 3-beta-galactosyltransferase 1; Core 1 O-glycan T-synthase; Core 1 UDP-galactose:N-acetylgalactosamine-alpha-R beta 1,3-galactosyltransferase 1; Core 1 beta1,3-galactosyltransferase 1